MCLHVTELLTYVDILAKHTHLTRPRWVGAFQFALWEIHVADILSFHLCLPFSLRTWLFRGYNRIRGELDVPLPTYPYGKYLYKPYYGGYLWYTQVSVDISNVEVYASRSDVHTLRSGLESQLTTLRSELSTLRSSTWRGGGLTQQVEVWPEGSCDICLILVIYTLEKIIIIWNPKPWRFGADGFPFQVLVIFRCLVLVFGCVCKILAGYL